MDAQRPVLFLDIDDTLIDQELLGLPWFQYLVPIDGRANNRFVNMLVR